MRIRVSDIFLSIYMFVVVRDKLDYINKHKHFVKFFLWWIPVYLLVDSGKPLMDSRFTTLN